MFNIQTIKKGRKQNPYLMSGAVAYWKLDEVSGTRYDVVGENDLTDVNSVGSTQGKIALCADFVASNSECLNIASNAALQVGNINFTFGAWVNLRSKPSFAYVLSKRNAPTVREYFIDYVSSSDRFRFGVSADGTNNVTVTANNFGSPSLNTWYYIMAWHDADSDTINISVNNGTPNSTAHSTGVFTGAGNFTLGAGDNTPTLFWDGYLDEVGFWKRLFTSSERAQLYNQGNGLTYPFA